MSNHKQGKAGTSVVEGGQETGLLGLGVGIA